MGIRSFDLTPDQRQYFTDVDNSILHHSVELGKVVLQHDSLKGALQTLYQARMKQMNAIVEMAGLDLSAVLGARVDPSGNLVVQVKDEPIPE